MKCDQALERMLVAEPSELRGGDRSALAVHVGGCARCRAVATRIVGDTAGLASAVAVESVRGAERVRVTRRAAPSVPWVRFLQAGLAVAPLVLVALPYFERGRGAVLQVPVSVAVEAVEAPPSAAGPHVPPSAAPVPRSSPRNVESPAPRPAPGASPTLDLGRDVSREVRPYVPVRYAGVSHAVVAPAATDDGSISANSSQQVTVVPQPGERALIARTSDPGITVVWLYR